MSGKLAPLVTNLTFPEAPRWHGDKLYFSDFFTHAVYAVGLDGRCEKVVEVPHQPSGLGWLPDGSLLVVSMADQKVLRLSGGELKLHADLSPFARFHCNDMIVLSDGKAFVGNFGFDPHHEQPRATSLICVDPDGQARIVAPDMAFPNGMVTLDNEKVLVVAESVAQCLTAFDIAADGALSNRRVLAKLDGCQPDGICVDGRGNILVTTMTCNTLVKFAPGGQFIGAEKFDTHLWACAVTDNGETLLCTADHFVESDCLREKSGKIQRVVG